MLKNMSYISTIFCVIKRSCLGSLILASTAFNVQQAAAAWFSDERAIMGTQIKVELWHENKDQAQAAIHSVMDEMYRIDRMMSPYKSDSELSQVNHNAAKHSVKINQELFDLIARSLKFSVLTNGAFDITYASIGHLYNYRKKIKPSTQRINQSLVAVDYRHILLDQERRSIKFSHSDVVIDLGGIAKGYAVDRCIMLLRNKGIKHAIVTAGGDSRMFGDHRGRPWMIGVRDPRKRSEMVAVLPVQNEAMSTSGDYERYFEKNGVRYHHILNPRTGRSVSESRSVTVLGPDATTTDALSTSLFVLGPFKAMNLVNSLDGIEAVIIDAAGHMHYSSGLQNLVATNKRP